MRKDRNFFFEGLPGVLGNKGTKLYNLEDESNFIKRGANKENGWEHGNIEQFWKGKREQGRPLGGPLHCV